MKRRFFCALLIALAASGSGSLGAPALGQTPEKITVYAAASLTEAFTAAVAEFTEETRIAVNLSYGGSDTLATQIKQGAPADVFASANVAQMKVVSDAGLLAGTPRTFAKNRLVLISPKASTTKLSSPADLAKPGLKVVLAAATVPVGGYARSTFAKLSGTSGYPPDFTAAVERNVVSNELDVKAVVAKISLNEGDAGVVYGTDVTPSVAAKLNVVPFPAAVAPDIEYPIGALKNAPNPRGAQAFIDYITSRQGQSYLKARGFIVP